MEDKLTKNELIALELTKYWCGQLGYPANSATVLDAYKTFRDRLNEEDKKHERT